MNDAEKIATLSSWRYRHGQVGFYSLEKLPQRRPITDDSYKTGWQELDRIFRFYLGQFIVLTGIAGHGKSTFILNLLCNLAKLHNMKSFLYVPENEAHLREKMRLIWNDSTTFGHFCAEQCFVQSAVQEPDSPLQTLRWVLEQAVVGVERDGARVVLIDPWNELDRAKPREMLMTDYIGECLMMLKSFCRSYNVIVVMVAHPTKAVNEHGGRIPGLADIEGSMNWFNKCDNGLIVVREKSKINTARVISAKVRESPAAGRLGVCEFAVDPETGIYTPHYGAVHEHEQ